MPNDHSSPPPRYLIPTAVFGAAPIAAAVLLLVALGRIDPAWAIVGGLAALAGAGLVIKFHNAELSILTAYVRALGETEAGVPMPGVVSGQARSLAVAIARLQRGWRRRHDQMTGELLVDRSILEALHDPLVVLDPGRRVVQANAAARGLFGDHILDRDLAACLRNPNILGAVDAVLAGGASRTVGFTLPIPVERVFEARVKPFGRTSGDVGGNTVMETVILTLHDVTAVKRSEQMRADFVANASHELRTPLSTLLGFIETLRGPARDDPEAQDRFLGIMHEQATRMSRLVSDLLSLSRIELDEHTPPTERADVADLLHTVVAGLELKAHGRGIRLDIDIPSAVPEIFGDVDQLTQVFQNLIDNAIKYSREQTAVTISVGTVDVGAIGVPPSTRHGFASGPSAPSAIPAVPRLSGRGRMVAVAVADSGDGIARTHLPRLTERFYRVDPARSRALGGTGLGLAIVKHIVNRHRGRLTIDSEVGRGSTFTVYLPVAPDIATETRPASAADDAA